MLCLGCASGLVALCSGGDAQARAEGDSGWTKQQTYNGALRYLRVDLGFEVTERDPDAAYLMFGYRTPGTRETTAGSIEIVEARGGVKLYVELPRMPAYHERVLRDGLLKKLRTEYGEPRKPSEDDKRPPGDAGAG